MPIATATYRRHKLQHREPSRRCARHHRDAQLLVEIRRVWYDSFGGVYGSKKVWEQLAANRLPPRCTVERLMRGAVLRGVVRGAVTRTTIGDAPATGRHRARLGGPSVAVLQRCSPVSRQRIESSPIATRARGHDKDHPHRTFAQFRGGSGFLSTSAPSSLRKSPL